MSGRVSDERPFEEFRRLEREAWFASEVSSAYDRYFSTLTAGAIPALLDAAGVRPGDRVADVACGPGRVSRAIGERGAVALSVDFSRPMLGLASRAGNTAVLRADAARLPIRSGTLQGLVSNFGLLHFPDPSRAISEAARALAPAGRTAWSVWAANAPAFRLISEAMENLGLRAELPSGPDFFQFSDPIAFGRVFQETGLRPKTPHRIDWIARVASAEDFWTMFHEGSARTRAALRSLTPQQSEQLKEEIGRRLGHFAVDAALEIPMAAMIGVAVKP